MDPVIDAQLKAAVRDLQEGRASEAIATLEAVLSDARAASHAELELVALALLGPAHVAIRDIEAARAHGEAGLEVARRLGDEGRITDFHTFLADISPDGSFHTADGDVVDRAFDDAARALTRGDGLAAAGFLTPLLEEAANFGDVEVEASASGMMAQAMIMVGRLDEARRQAQRAVDLAEHLHDEAATEHFHQLLASLDTAAHAEEAVALSQVSARARAAATAAGKTIEAGAPAEALQLVYPVLREAVSHGARAAEATLRGVIAQALLASDKKDEAIEQANKAATLADELGDANAAASFRQIVEFALGFLPPAGEA